MLAFEYFLYMNSIFQFSKTVFPKHSLPSPARCVAALTLPGSEEISEGISLHWGCLWTLTHALAAVRALCPALPGAAGEVPPWRGIVTSSFPTSVPSDVTDGDICVTEPLSVTQAQAQLLVSLFSSDPFLTVLRDTSLHPSI